MIYYIKNKNKIVVRSSPDPPIFKKIVVRSNPDPAKIGFSPDPVLIRAHLWFALSNRMNKCFQFEFLIAFSSVFFIAAILAMSTFSFLYQNTAVEIFMRACLFL